MEEKLEKVLAEEGFLDALVACETAEDVQALFESKGVALTLEDIQAISRDLSSAFDEGEELGEDFLDAVAGGAMIRRAHLMVSDSIKGHFSKKDFIDKRRLHQTFKRW